MLSKRVLAALQSNAVLSRSLRRINHIIVDAARDNHLPDSHREREPPDDTHREALAREDALVRMKHSR